MLATKGRYHNAANPPSVPVADQRFLASIISRHLPDVRTLLSQDPTILFEEAGTAFLVTRACPDETTLFLHAHPGEIEVGVAEEQDYPLLSLVVSVRTPGDPRNAGLILDVADPAAIRLFCQMISQPFVDLAVLDPESRFLAAFRFELTLWTRAHAHRVLDQARRHLEILPPDRRNFTRAVAALQDYLNTQIA